MSNQHRTDHEDVDEDDDNENHDMRSRISNIVEIMILGLEGP